MTHLIIFYSTGMHFIQIFFLINFLSAFCSIWIGLKILGMIALFHFFPISISAIFRNFSSLALFILANWKWIRTRLQSFSFFLRHTNNRWRQLKFQHQKLENLIFEIHSFASLSKLIFNEADQKVFLTISDETKMQGIIILCWFHTSD